MTNQKFSKQFVNALLHFLYNFFIYFLFVVPFDLWKKAAVRLSNQREHGKLNITKINSPWPFLSFLKVFILDFLIDGIIFMNYVWGILISIALGVDGGFGGFIMTLLGVYYSPIVLSYLRDIIQLAILPFKKFLSWASKPAQYMDLEIKNK